MTTIYTFLRNRNSCSRPDSLEACTKECHAIREHPSDVPCILVEDGRVFLECDQLTFEVSKELSPHLYKVPREYGAFEHLFQPVLGP